MLAKFKVQSLKFKVILIFFCLITYYLLLTTSVYATCDATELAKPVDQRSADCPAGLDQIELMIGNILSLIVGIGFITMLILLVWAGFKYLTSGGEPKAIQSAHSVTTWALLGLFFMALAWLILQLLAGFSGINLTTFDIKALCGDAPNFPFCSPSPLP